jgi:hypothetical protein
MIILIFLMVSVFLDKLNEYFLFSFLTSVVMFVIEFFT